MPFIKLMAVAILAFSLPTLAFAELVVSHYEILQSVRITETGRALSMSSQAQAPSAIKLSFDAMGRDFELQLESHERLLAALPSAAIRGQIGVYRGRLSGTPDSWARVVVVDGVPRGLFFDGKELFAIEAPDDSELPVREPVIFRLSDAAVAPGSMRCGVHALAGRADVVLQQAGAAAKAAAQGPGAVSEITMSVIGDTEFTALRGGDLAAATAIITRFNNIDGYFSEQVGVQIDVRLIETYETPADPFDDTQSSDSLLDQLSEYRFQTPVHNAEGLTHLFTGRNLDSTTIGIAWRGALCDDYFGAGLTEARGGAVNDSLVAAHEIGHNFNAQHDGEAGSSCEGVSGDFIMSATINGSRNFSDCSIAIMQAEAARAACVVPLPTVDVAVEYASELDRVLLGSSNDFSFEISNNGTVAASDVDVSVSVPPMLGIDAVAASAGSCTSGAGFVNCELGTLEGLQVETVTVTATAATVGTGTLSATASTSDAEERAGNNRDAREIRVDPAVDLIASPAVLPAVFLGEAASGTATIRNAADVDATDVLVTLALDSGLQATAASWTAGNCTVAAQLIQCEANSVAAQSQDTINFSVRGVTVGTWGITISATAAEADVNSANNDASGQFQVREQNRGKGGGGGVFGPLCLLVGGSLYALRRRKLLIRK